MKWYIYTLAYNGESYFADHVFHLSEDQKTLADNYARNLSLFLGDGMFQNTQYGGSTIESLGNVRFSDGVTEVVYFNQMDKRYANKPYQPVPATGEIPSTSPASNRIALVIFSHLTVTVCRFSCP